MRFAFTEDQLAIANTVDAFLIDAATGDGTRAAMADGTGLDPSLWRAMAVDLGLTGIAVQEAHGGSALGMVEIAMVSEALGRRASAVPWLASVVIATTAIRRGGSTAQCDTWLPRLASGEVIASFAIGDIYTDGSGLSGTADFVPHGAIADLLVVPIGNKTFLVPRSAPGVAVTSHVTMDQTRPLARVTFNDAAAELLPQLDWSTIEPSAWTAIAADALGGAQSCLDTTVAYVQDRVQFGRAIGSFQAVKHQLADMLIAIEQARSAVYWAAGEIDAGGADARLAAHAAKSFACDTYADCAGQAIQLHGGIGFTWEHDAHLFFKRARANASLLGTSSWHREQIAQLMGLGTPCT